MGEGEGQEHEAMSATIGTEEAPGLVSVVRASEAEEAASNSASAASSSSSSLASSSLASSSSSSSSSSSGASIVPLSITPAAYNAHLSPQTQAPRSLSAAPSRASTEAPGMAQPQRLQLPRSSSLLSTPAPSPRALASSSSVTRPAAHSKTLSTAPAIKTKHRKIDKKHPEFALSFAMMLGIRTVVSKTEAKIHRELEPQDFKDAVKLNFPGRGSLLTPAHEMRDFKFKDYCPLIFKKIRELSLINPADYLLCLCGNFSLLEFVSNSKSGAFFFYSHDRQFMIKTVSKAECRFLRSILPEYYRHILENPSTLLTRFFGMHKVAPYKKKKRHFLIMSSVFYTDKYIHTVYDLKGSSQGRNATAKEKQLPNCVLKDNDFLESQQKLNLDVDKAARLNEQIAKDVEFLRSLSIMDYSILLGIHRKDLPVPGVYQDASLNERERDKGREKELAREKEREREREAARAINEKHEVAVALASTSASTSAVSSMVMPSSSSSSSLPVVDASSAAILTAPEPLTAVSSASSASSTSALQPLETRSLVVVTQNLHEADTHLPFPQSAHESPTPSESPTIASTPHFHEDGGGNSRETPTTFSSPASLQQTDALSDVHNNVLKPSLSAPHLESSASNAHASTNGTHVDEVVVTIEPIPLSVARPSSSSASSSASSSDHPVADSLASLPVALVPLPTPLPSSSSASMNSLASSSASSSHQLLTPVQPHVPSAAISSSPSSSPQLANSTLGHHHNQSPSLDFKRQSAYGLPKRWDKTSKPSDVAFDPPEFEPVFVAEQQVFDSPRHARSSHERAERMGSDAGGNAMALDGHLLELQAPDGSPTLSHTVRYSQFSRLNLHAATEDEERGSSSSSSSSSLALLDFHGGMDSVDEKTGQEGKEIYFVGIIDILTVYNLGKWVENRYKRASLQKGISAVSPRKYAERFKAFFTAGIRAVQRKKLSSDT